MEKKKYKVGYTTGVFDLFHIGHLNILKRSKELCEFLIVGVSTDELVKSYKQKSPAIAYDERVVIVQAIQYVDKVVPQETLDKVAAHDEYKFDVMFHGDDWKDSSVFAKAENELKNRGAEVIYFPYTKATSSTLLINALKSLVKAQTIKPIEDIMEKYSMEEVQLKILEIMKYVNKKCRDNDIVYYIMGGTALGAVRHRGFIPWDDDLDIFMTPDNYEKFKSVFASQKGSRFEIQEWRLGSNPLEYAKVRMNDTTFIEASFKENRNMHHGVYIDIMILHKCPKNRIKQSLLFLFSRYVTVQALAERNWIPKSKLQAFILRLIHLLPKHFMSGYFYKQIYRYDKQDMRDYQYCYFITKARFNQAVFPKEMFMEPVEIAFENTKLLAPTDIHGYLKIRFGNYMALPPEEEREAARHAEIIDLEKDYREYFT